MAAEFGRHFLDLEGCVFRMPEKKRFGKCDECGAIGPLEEIFLTGNHVNAHFCVDCEKIFLNRSELSSFIAFQYSKPPQKNIEPVKAM